MWGRVSEWRENPGLGVPGRDCIDPSQATSKARQVCQAVNACVPYASGRGVVSRAIVYNASYNHCSVN